MWVRGHWRSLNVVPFESLGMVSYSSSIVTMAVSAAILEIFSVKEWIDLEIWVWGPSRSLRMAPFDTPRMTLLVSHCNYSFILYHLRVIWHLIIRWPWNMAYRSLKITETGAIQKLGCGFLFAFYSIYGRIFSYFGDIPRQRMTWPWNVGFGLFKVIENDAVR